MSLKDEFWQKKIIVCDGICDLVSCFSKLFTTILNKRIETFCNENTIISNAHFGFRKGYSTVDAFCILMSIVYNYLNKRL